MTFSSANKEIIRGVYEFEHSAVTTVTNLTVPAPTITHTINFKRIPNNSKATINGDTFRVDEGDSVGYFEEVESFTITTTETDSTTPIVIHCIS